MLDVKELVARALLDIKAVHFNEETPFVFTSGTVSPVYCDCRKLISFPRQRRLVMALAQGLLAQEAGGEAFDVIAGGETAGIPYAAFLAEALDLPMVYVRKAAKKFGRLAQIEGDLAPGARALLVEDLLFDAQSKIHFADALRRAGAVVGHTLVVMDYGNPASLANLARHELHLHALSDWATVVRVGETVGSFTAAQAAVIRDFLADPPGWAGRRAAPGGT